MIQILKGFNVVVVYLVSLVIGVAVWNWRLALVIVAIACALTVAVASHGDISGYWWGVVIQIVSQAFDMSKLMLLSWFLGNAADIIDPFTLIMVVAPTACIATSIYQFVTWDDNLLPALVQSNVWPLIICSTLLSYSALVLVNEFLRISNAVSYLMTGIIKNVFIMFASVVLFHDSLQPVEIAMFLLASALIALYGMMKIYREEFEAGFAAGFQALFLDFQYHVLRIQSAKQVDPRHDEENPLLEDSFASFYSKFSHQSKLSLASKTSNMSKLERISMVS